MVVWAIKGCSFSLFVIESIKNLKLQPGEMKSTFDQSLAEPARASKPLIKSIKKVGPHPPLVDSGPPL
jgi:hypothetical protein